MHELFNSLGNKIYDKLSDFDHSIHQSGHSDSLIDNFIHELKDYLFVSDAKYKLSKIPTDSILEINEIEDKYVQCYLNHKDFLIPNEMIDISKLDAKDIGFIRITATKRRFISCS